MQFYKSKQAFSALLAAVVESVVPIPSPSSGIWCGRWWQVLMVDSGWGWTGWDCGWVRRYVRFHRLIQTIARAALRARAVLLVRVSIRLKAAQKNRRDAARQSRNQMERDLIPPQDETTVRRCANQPESSENQKDENIPD